MKRVLKFLGPAFIISVAYIDPGNFAVNINCGSLYGYNLIWVVLVSNIFAMFLQILSAKLGIETGRNLPQMCRKVFSKKTNYLLWIMAEFSAMATTIAEFLGGALGFYLLLKIPLVFAGILTLIITMIITYAQKYGQRTVEIIIILLVAVICISYSIEMLLSTPDWRLIGIHFITPKIESSGALLTTVGMLGATIMPHVIYLHSQLVQCRNDEKSEADKKTHLKMEKLDIFLAMNIAFIINASMVIVSASVFNSNGIIINTIEEAHKSLMPLLGNMSSTFFAVALLASGFSSSAVGTMAGETILDGFVDVKKIPSYVKRLITVFPAVLIIIMGVNPMKALILSQVCLSFTLPFAIIPLLIITGRVDLMGSNANNIYVKLFGVAISIIIITLNFILLYLLL